MTKPAPWFRMTKPRETMPQRIVGELKDAGGYDETDLTMVVKNAAGRTVFSIPFVVM
jgi:hypothetical protein